MWLVVGLGNPGTEYAQSRHNIGFLVVDELGRRACVAGFRDKHGGLLASAKLAHTTISLLKPMEYMNLSGQAVVRAAGFYRAEPAHVVVVHDEVDLPLGQLRLKVGGGHGGHNGVRSIIDLWGQSDFVRVRCGVGRPQGGNMTGHVLGRFSPDEAGPAGQLTSHAADAVEAIIARGPLLAMNTYNKTPGEDNDQ